MIFLSLAFIFLFFTFGTFATEQQILASISLSVSISLFAMAGICAIGEIFLPGILWIGIN